MTNHDPIDSKAARASEQSHRKFVRHYDEERRLDDLEEAAERRRMEGPAEPNFGPGT